MKTTTMTDFDATRGLAIGLLALLALFTGTFTLSMLWAWFAVPLGVPAIGMAHAFGLSCLMAMFQNTLVQMDKKLTAMDRATIVLMKHGLLLGLGYVAKGLMG